MGIEVGIEIEIEVGIDIEVDIQIDIQIEIVIEKPKLILIPGKRDLVLPVKTQIIHLLNCFTD
jgi:hypothetical protein